MMTIQELFVASNRALGKAIAQISDDQWDMPMPPGTSSKPTTLKEAVNYHTYDDAWVPDVLAGKTKEEVGEAYDLLLKADGEAVQANYQNYSQIAADAVQHFSNLDQVTHLSYGDFPARDYLQHIISFRALRSYDIAKMIGADTTMDEDFVSALDAEFSPVVEDYRKMGVFPPAVKAAADANPQAKLLAMFGRS